jgi:hypothetical protein
VKAGTPSLAFHFSALALPGFLGIFGLLAGANTGCQITLRFGEPDAASGAVGCISDDGCPIPSLHCDLSSGQCVPCVSDVDCAGSDRPRCDIALHRCIECGIAQDCGNGYVCEPTTHRCQQTCLSSDQCTEDVETCDASRDVCIGCLADIDCTDRAPAL